MGSWADALTSGEVSPQANKASPASLMFMGATQSALAENPHSTQVNCACLLRLSPEVCPHSRHWRLVFIGGTATSMPPRHLVLYSNWRRSSNGLASRMERFRPDLALTLLPGCSLVPASFVKRKCSKREPPKQVQIGRSLSSQQVGKSQLTGYPPYPRKTRLARFY